MAERKSKGRRSTKEIQNDNKRNTSDWKSLTRNAMVKDVSGVYLRGLMLEMHDLCYGKEWEQEMRVAVDWKPPNWSGLSIKS
jgi:hypothetical protein